jgi:hypothetical protein
MVRRGIAAATMVLIGALAARAQQDECRAVIDKAIQAHGGVKVTKLRLSHVKFKGTIAMMGGLDFTGETFVHLPNRFKNVLQLEIKNMNLTLTQVFDGKKFWMNIMDKTIELDDPKILREVKENLYVDSVAGLIGHDRKGVKLSPLGEVKINDEDAVGVRVSLEGHRDVNLFFDKKSSLLVKSESRAFDPMTQKETSQEKFYRKYKAQNGIQIPWHIDIHQDGKSYIDVQITDVAYPERFDDGTFAKP